MMDKNDSLLTATQSLRRAVSSGAVGVLSSPNEDISTAVAAFQKINEFLNSPSIAFQRISPELQSGKTNALLDVGILSRLEARGTLSKLAQAVPEQRIAPAQFEVRDGRLVLVKKSSEAGIEDRDNAEVARQELISRGGRLLMDLAASNCDRRLIAELQYLHDLLRDDQNVIRVAMANQSVEVVVKGYLSELPDITGNLLGTYSRWVSAYVAQFPDWQRFTENDIIDQLDERDLLPLKEGAKKIADERSAHRS
ncbi:hypothetical protein [Dankookia sp. P2]|uniref:hypothetical protein n=1 Tax=Dankookia sp. P2 TaxID=3423955 RepID=UPI003D677972